MARLNVSREDVNGMSSKLDTRPARLLSDRTAIELLPRCLTVRNWMHARVATPLFQFVRRDHDISRSHIKVDTNTVPRMEQGHPAARGRLRRSIENGRRARCPGLSTIAHTGQRGHAPSNQGVRRLHVDHLGSARITDWASAPDEKHASLIDPQ